MSETKRSSQGAASVVECKEPPSRLLTAAPTQAFVLLVVAASLAYAGSLSGTFVLDDDEAIVNNLFIRTLWPPETALAAPPHSAVSRRPLVSFSLALNYALGGLEPVGYRLWNIAVHFGVSLLLYGVLRRTLRCRGVPTALQRGADSVALATAVLWAVHPINSEVVYYTIQRTESMMAFCYMLTLYAASRGFWAERRAAGWLALSVSACFAGAACKESIVTAPVVILVYDAVFFSGSWLGALRGRGWYYAGLALSWVALYALSVGNPRSGAGFESDISSWTYLLQQGPMIGTYLRLAVWPSPLVADYGSALPVAPSGAMEWLFVVAIMIALVVWLWCRNPRLGFLGVWFFLTLAPASSIVPISTEVGAERRMYLPMAALVVLGVIGIRAVITRLTPPRRSYAVSLVAVMVAWAGLTITTSARNSDFKDRLQFWQSIVERLPHGRAHHNLGIELWARGRRTEAIEQYRLAAVEEPKAQYSLAHALASVGRIADAAAEAQDFLRRRPDSYLAADAASLLGLALDRQGDHEGAIVAFARALAMRPNDPRALAGLADSLRSSGRLREAATAYRAYLTTTPQDAAAFSNLGVVLSMSGRLDEAVDAFGRSVELSPESADARLNYGLSLLDAGRLEDAIVQFRHGLNLDPRHGRLRNQIEALSAR